MVCVSENPPQMDDPPQRDYVGDYIWREFFTHVSWCGVGKWDVGGFGGGGGVCGCKWGSEDGVRSSGVEGCGGGAWVVGGYYCFDDSIAENDVRCDETGQGSTG